HIVSVECVLI
ncbi:hypothetical protein CP8484711_1575B, partial [Chlamydia psittaci 84-8471/1]